MEITQKTDEEREMEARISSGPVSARGPTPSKGQAPPRSALAGALALAGISVSSSLSAHAVRQVCVHASSCRQMDSAIRSLHHSIALFCQ